MSLSRGFVLWLTGPEKAGKSTLAERVAKEILRRGQMVEVLDENEVRAPLSAELADDPGGRGAHAARLAFVATRLARNGIPTIVAARSPERGARDDAREAAGEFVEVHVKCPANVCTQRAGAAIDETYEPTDDPECVVETNLDTEDECAEAIVTTLEMLQYLEPAAETYTAEQDAEVRTRLADLGYI